ncbi:MAG: pseudouridine synthase [Clostridia bacterium]
MRINKYLAECGVCSRRKADEIISSGKVSVNRKVITELGVDIDVEKDVVYLDGKKIVLVTHYDYIMFNKPKGCVTTMSDEFDKGTLDVAVAEGETPSRASGKVIKAKPTKYVNVGNGGNSTAGFDDDGQAEEKRKRKTIYDFFKSEKRLFPVGRLDYDSEGLLLLTNDGDLTYKLTHPSSEIPKTYIVKIDDEIQESDLAILRKGVTVDGVKFSHCKVKVTGIENGLTRLEVIIFEGKNREIRRMFEAVEKKVVFLKRVAIGDLKLGGLSRGGNRELNDGEVAYLKKLCEAAPVSRPNNDDDEE